MLGLGLGQGNDFCNIIKKFLPYQKQHNKLSCASSSCCCCCWQGSALSMVNITPICSQLPICEAAAQQQSQNMPQRPRTHTLPLSQFAALARKYFQQSTRLVNVCETWVWECMYKNLHRTHYALIHTRPHTHALSSQTHLASVLRPGQKHVQKNRTSQERPKRKLSVCVCTYIYFFGIFYFPFFGIFHGKRGFVYAASWANYSTLTW